MVVADEIQNNCVGNFCRLFNVMSRVLNYSASFACTYSFCSHRGGDGYGAVCTHPSDYLRFHLLLHYSIRVCVPRPSSMDC